MHAPARFHSVRERSDHLDRLFGSSSARPGVQACGMLLKQNGVITTARLRQPSTSIVGPHSPVGLTAANVRRRSTRRADPGFLVEAARRFSSGFLSLEFDQRGRRASSLTGASTTGMWRVHYECGDAGGARSWGSVKVEYPGAR